MAFFDAFRSGGSSSDGGSGSGSNGDGSGSGSSSGSEGGLRGLVNQVRGLPEQISALIRAEIDKARAELIAKLKKAGIGIGMLVVAAVFGFLLLEVLVAAAILGVATALPAWLAALLVAVGLLIVTAIFALVGQRMLKKGTPPAPTETVKNLRSDLRTQREDMKHESEDV